MVAGETSGDLLGANLLSALRPQLPDTLMHGIGGPTDGEIRFRQQLADGKAFRQRPVRGSGALS